MTSLNDLPFCLLVKILSNLPIDQVIRLKLVCKAWCEASAFVRYRSLCFYRFDFEADDNWWLPLEVPKDCDLLVNDLEKFFKSAGSMVSGVQRLKIQLHAHPLNFEKNCLQNFLHRFKRVQELEILIDPSVEQLPELILEFKLLRKMCLEICDWVLVQRLQRLELDCPQLSYLDIDCIANCRVSHPEKLQTLVVKVPLEEHQIRTFANLKNLVISTDHEEINSIPRIFYRSLPKSLQRLIVFTRDFFGDIRSDGYPTYRNSEENLRAHYAIDQEESSLRVFLCGIETSLSQLQAVHPFYSNENLQFMITNLTKSVDGNVCFNRLLYYNIIERLPTFDLLHKKICSDFPYSEVILDRSAVDQDRLLEFIRKVRPNRLRLRSAKHFPCTFFERLAEIASPFIEELEFDSQAFDYEPGAFDFLFKMSGLNRVLIKNRKTVDLDLLLVAYEKFEDLPCISFHLGVSSFYPEPCDSTISVTFSHTNDRIDGVDTWLSVEDNEVSFNTLDVLRYLRDRLNGRQASFLELALLTGELECQRQMNQFAFNMIVDYTKAIQIYL